MNITRRTLSKALYNTRNLVIYVKIIKYILCIEKIAKIFYISMSLGAS